MDSADFRTLQDRGWVVVPNAVTAASLERLRDDLTAATEACEAMRRARGLFDGTEGTAHHVLSLGQSFVDLVDDLPVRDILAAHFGGPFILNSFGGVDNRPSTKAYVHNAHRDVRWFTPGFVIMAQALVMLDDFTLENGATKLLAGSHLHPDKPSAEEFEAKCDRATGTAGSILVFDAKVWHATGENRTRNTRRALTLTFTQPFVKPQIDHVRQLGSDRVAGMSERFKRIIGWYSRVPANHDEWYQPRETRFSQE